MARAIPTRTPIIPRTKNIMVVSLSPNELLMLTVLGCSQNNFGFAVDPIIKSEHITIPNKPSTCPTPFHTNDKLSILTSQGKQMVIHKIKLMRNK